jgi:hypothetical protein
MSQKNSSFAFSEVVLPSRSSRLVTRAYRDRHDTRGGDAVGVSMLQRDLIMPTNNLDAHGQVVWS